MDVLTPITGEELLLAREPTNSKDKHACSCCMQGRKCHKTTGVRTAGELGLVVVCSP